MDYENWVPLCCRQVYLWGSPHTGDAVEYLLLFFISLNSLPLDVQHQCLVYLQNIFPLKDGELAHKNPRPLLWATRCWTSYLDVLSFLDKDLPEISSPPHLAAIGGNYTPGRGKHIHVLAQTGQTSPIIRNCSQRLSCRLLEGGLLYPTDPKTHSEGPEVPILYANLTIGIMANSVLNKLRHQGSEMYSFARTNMICRRITGSPLVPLP